MGFDIVRYGRKNNELVANAKIYDDAFFVAGNWCDKVEVSSSAFQTSEDLWG